MVKYLSTIFFVTALFAQAADKGAANSLLDIMKKNFVAADFLTQNLFPIGFSPDGKKFAYFGQFGNACKLNSKLNKYFVDDPGPDSEEEVSSYSCLPEGVSFFGIINLTTDALIPIDAEPMGDCSGFTSQQMNQKKFSFSNCTDTQAMHT